MQIEHPAFVAPLLNFFHPAAIRFAHTQFCVAKSVVRKTRIVELESVSAVCAEIGKNLPLEKFEKNRL